MKAQIILVPMAMMATAALAIEPSGTTKFDCELISPSGDPVEFRGSFQGGLMEANFSDLGSRIRPDVDWAEQEIAGVRDDQSDLCITLGPPLCHSIWTASSGTGQQVRVQVEEWYTEGVAAVIINERWHNGRHSTGGPIATGYCKTKRVATSVPSEEEE